MPFTRLFRPSFCPLQGLVNALTQTDRSHLQILKFGRKNKAYYEAVL